MKSLFLAFFACLSFAANAMVVLDFEGPLPLGLVPTSFGQGSYVPVASIVTDQFISLGVEISGAALVAAGRGHSASGTNSLAGIDSNGNIDYDVPVTFSFFGDFGSTVGTTDYFAYSADLGGGSQNLITLSAFAVDGSLLGQVQYVEISTFRAPLFISGLGQFHSVTIDQTLYDTSSGGIAIDLVTFGDVINVPEPSSLVLFAVGLVGLFCSMSRRVSS
jgi:hypothetical protein